MNSKLILFYVLALILFNPVYSEICKYGENDCLLHQSRAFYKKVVNGVDGVIEPSDPIYSDEIKRKVKCLKLRLTNVIFTGLKNCEVKKTVLWKAFEKDTLNYHCTLFCPKLVLKYNFETNGQFEPVNIARKGNSTLTATNYVMIFKGKSVKFISKKDNKPHYSMKVNSIKTKAKGKLLLETSPKNKTKEETEETLDYFNSNRKVLEYFIQWIIRDLMKILKKRPDTYLRTLPIDKVFFSIKA